MSEMFFSSREQILRVGPDTIIRGHIGPKHLPIGIKQKGCRRWQVYAFIGNCIISIDQSHTFGELPILRGNRTFMDDSHVSGHYQILIIQNIVIDARLFFHGDCRLMIDQYHIDINIQC